jgi:dynactin complex subunit
MDLECAIKDTGRSAFDLFREISLKIACSEKCHLSTDIENPHLSTVIPSFEDDIENRHLKITFIKESSSREFPENILGKFTVQRFLFVCCSNFGIL